MNQVFSRAPDPVSAIRAESTPALEVSGVSAGYGSTTILRDVDISVERGTVAVLLGPNGAGKSTLLKVAAGLLRPSEGAITLNGADVTRRRAFQRNRAGLCMIPDGRGVFRSLTVRENLVLQVTRKERDDAIQRALAAFPPLAKRLSHEARQLSGGEQQMLALARCYLNPSDVILVDEVSMGLAPLMVRAVFGALDSLHKQGVALVVVEQYVDQALALADVVYVMNRGRLQRLGTPDEIDRDELMQMYLGVQSHR